MEDFTGTVIKIPSKRLSEIKNIRDEDINCSDIPEGTKQDFQKARLVMPKSFDKRWVVLRFVKNGKYEIVADYGVNVWDSPIYEVIGYRQTSEEARQLIKDHQEGKSVE